MNNRYKSFNYEITYDPEFINKQFSIPPELSRQFESLYRKAQKGGEKIIDRLQKLIKKYPEVPQLKNYLSVAYITKGEGQKGREVNNWIIKEHPDYLFGRLNQAFEHYNNKDFEKIPEVIGSLLDIQDLYPERDCFHISEITAFNKLAILYFSAVGNIEAAESRYEMLKELAPDHPDTESVYPYLMRARLDAAANRYESEEKSRIKVKTRPTEKKSQRETKPAFTHKEIQWLYEASIRIEKEKLKSILELPYETLVQDLLIVLKDCIYRYDHFTKLADETEEYPEEKLSFPIHSIFLLGELRAEESLETVLEVLGQDEDFLDFWFGDFLTVILREPLYYIGNTQLDTLKDFVLSPGIYTYARTEISATVEQIAIHQPERMEEVVNWYHDIFTSIAESSMSENIIDSDFIGMAISDVIEINAPELLPQIKKLYDLGYVGVGICGTFDTVERDIKLNNKDRYKLDLLNIYDRYEQILSSWHSYSEEADWSQNVKEITENSKKTGRNDPCPCGSGKKYKKCCLNKKL